MFKKKNRKRPPDIRKTFEIFKQFGNTEEAMESMEPLFQDCEKQGMKLDPIHRLLIHLLVEAHDRIHELERSSVQWGNSRRPS